MNGRRIIVRKVETRSDMSLFVDFANMLYKNCPYFVPDLNIDVREAFDPKKNAALESSEAQPFIAIDERGNIVGRIAAFVNHRANEKWNVRNVRFGYFDFYDDRNVSAALIKAVEDWGKAKGMDSIQGPMGIFDFDKEGMLIEDFNRTSSMITIYNYSYYPQHMEALGFKKEVDWVQVRVRVPEATPEKFARVAEVAKKRSHLTLRKLSPREVLHKGYGRKIFDLLNKAYSPLFGYTELSGRQIDFYVERYLRFVDMSFVPVVMNADDEMVGVAVTMSSITEALKKSQGRLLPLGWFHLLRSLKWHHEDTVDMLLIAVRPDYQGRGVNAIFFDDLIPLYIKHGFKWAETGPQLEDNMKELSQWSVLNPEVIKRRRCYIKHM